MRPSRVQIPIEGLMTAVAVLAILFTLPSASAANRAFVVLAVLVLLPTALAPRGERLEVAYWTMALYPMMVVISVIGRFGGAGMEVPRLRELALTYRRRARSHAGRERHARREAEEHGESLAYWSAVAAGREEAGRALGSTSPPDGGPDSAGSGADRVTPASEQPEELARLVALWERRVAHYDRMRRKWQRAAFYPWRPVEPDPPEPES